MGRLDLLLFDIIKNKIQKKKYNNETILPTNMK